MKSLLSCLAVLTVGTLVIAQQPPPSDTRKPTDTPSGKSIDGSWTVISAEKNGQPMADAANMTVTIRDNTITCSGKEGKPAMTLKVDFAAMGRAKVTEQSAASGGTGTSTGSGDKGTSREAVYVLTNDYLAVCVHDDKSDPVRQASATDTGSGTGAITTSAPVSKSYCTIILKRASSSERR